MGALQTRRQANAQIADAALVEQMEVAYGIAVADLTRMRGGESAQAFRATGADGKQWFVKLVAPDPCYPRDPLRLDAALRLTAALRDRVRAAAIIAPVWTRVGEPSAVCGDLRLVVFPFVEARPLGREADWSDESLTAVARAVGEIQRCTTEFGHLAPAVERFDLGYEAALPQALDGLEQLSSPVRPSQQEARDLVLARRHDVERLVVQHRALQAHARHRQPRLVLCHTDLNGDNLLVNALSGVYIVDWDDLCLAPPEQDVRYILDLPRLDRAISAYEAAAGRTELDADVFAFYFYRRVLVDLAYFVCRILQPGRTDAQDEHDLAVIRSDCWWAFDGGIEREIENLRVALGERRTSVK